MLHAYDKSAHSRKAGCVRAVKGRVFVVLMIVLERAVGVGDAPYHQLNGA